MRKFLALMCIAMFLFAASKGTGMVTSTRVAQPPVNEPAQPVVTVDRTGYYPSQPEPSKSYFVPVTYGNATEISFSNGIAFDTRNLGKSGEPALPEDLRISYQDNESGYYIIQFSGPVYKAQRDWIQSKGIDIHFYIPNYGFVCTIKNKAQADDIRTNPAVNWAGIYQPAYKISTLFDRVGQETKVVVLLFLDADLASTLDEVRAITSRSEFDVSDNGINKMIFGKVNKDQLHQLARIKGVYWIEPDLEKVPHNQQYQWVVMTGYRASVPAGNDNTARRIWGMGILGQGEIIGHDDSGIDCSHYAKRANSTAITTWGVYPTHNKIVAYDSGAATTILYGDNASYHGSHTSGTIAGNDTVLDVSYYDGIAKMARIYHNDCGGSSTTSIYTFGDLNDLFIRSYNKYYASNGIRAYSSSNSWGAPLSYGVYNTNSLTSDQFMWGHKDYCIFYSMGNDGGPSGTCGAPATAKSVVSVGGTSNSTSCRTFYTVSSRGPTADGRMKPDILTPGNAPNSSINGPNFYTTNQGTSMSCPGAAASGALVRQYLREGWYPYGKKVAGAGWAYISAAMIKAVLINSGDNDMTGYVTPNNNTGWGRVDLDSALYFNGDARKTMVFDDTIGVLTGERVEYHFNVPSGAANLKIAVVWTDYPGTPSASRQLVNDLDVTVIGGGSTYLGNVYTGGESSTGGSRDSLNIVECVRRNSPTAGDWLVRIEGRNVPLGPQPFALVISYNATSVAGAVTTDKPMYRANDFFIDTVRIRVEDTNYGTVGVRDTVRITIHGKYIEAQVETLKCAELAESAYVFKGTIPLLFHKPVHGDNRVSVCQGDTLTVTYVDANPAYTCYTWAAIDADYFIISNVHCENIDAFSVEACWTTNDNSTSKVYYGTNPSNLNLTAQLDTPYMIPHRIKLSGLSSKTTYYYDVESKDFRGNQVRDNNHDAHYSFTTKGSAGTDVLVVLLNSNLQGEEFAHPEFLQTALTTGGWTYNWWNTRDNGQFTRNQLKGYKAVYFQVGQENYPVWTVAQKETIKLYHDGGARFSMTGHDAGWDPWRNSPTADTLFCKNYLHFRYIGDIVSPTWSLRGIAGDPISGAYSGGVTYQPFRVGAAADSILLSGTGAAGTGSYVWHGSVANDSCGIKWESTANMGSLGDGIWGGRRTRVVHNGFEITQIDTVAPNSPSRTDILNNVFIWLIGHDHPDVTLTSPVGGNTYNTSPISIAWTATAYGGTTIDSTWIEYSPDAGQTWFTIIAGTGITSPYSWNITALSNGGKYQVKVTVSDAGVYPSMKGFAQTTNFTLNRTGGDLTGPVTIPNSIVMLFNANPKIVTPAAGDTLVSFTAVISDSNTGLSTIGAARWYIAGYDTFNCYANDGSYNSVLETVRGDIRIFYLPGTTDICSLYVRGRDNAAKALNWGIWYMRTFTLIDGGLGINVDEFGTLVPFSYGLSVPLPNPSVNHIKIAFALPHPKKVKLNVYNSVGQLVKTLIDENRAPGVYTVVWDGTDDNGRSAAAGIYFYQYSTDEFNDTKKAVLIR